MAAHEPNPDEQLQNAWQHLRQHRLVSDADLKSRIEAVWHQENRQFWFRTGIGTGVVALSLGGAALTSNSQSHAGLEKVALVLIFFLFLIIGWGMTLHKHFQRKQQLDRAQEAIDRRDYSSNTLGSVLRCWCADITPLKQDDWNWRGVSESLRNEENQELSTIWATWLLSDLPIREMDVETLQRVIRAKKKAAEWHAQQQGSHQQHEGRQMALDSLPPELVSSLKGDLLEQRLVTVEAAGHKPRL